MKDSWTPAMRTSEPPRLRRVLINAGGPDVRLPGEKRTYGGRADLHLMGRPRLFLTHADVGSIGIPQCTQAPDLVEVCYPIGEQAREAAASSSISFGSEP
jgi:hypothetical protein